LRIIVVGGGIAGLGTALACARDGHVVTVLERDDTPMPTDADAAFEWQRTGAPQVRHSHAFLARLRNLLRDRAPDVLGALLRAGATEIPFTAHLPTTLSDQLARPGDGELVALACRRTTFEWVLRRLVLDEPGVELGHGPPRPQAQVGRHLVVARSAGMQASRQRPDPLGEGGLEVEMNVLEGGIPGERAGRHLRPQRFEAGDHCVALLGGQQARGGQSVDVGDRTDEIVVGQRRVDLDRSGEVRTALVAPLVEPAAPEIQSSLRHGVHWSYARPS